MKYSSSEVFFSISLDVVALLIKGILFNPGMPLLTDLYRVFVDVPIRYVAPFCKQNSDVRFASLNTGTCSLPTKAIDSPDFASSNFIVVKPFSFEKGDNFNCGPTSRYCVPITIAAAGVKEVCWYGTALIFLNSAVVPFETITSVSDKVSVLPWLSRNFIAPSYVHLLGALPKIVKFPFPSLLRNGLTEIPVVNGLP